MRFNNVEIVPFEPWGLSIGNKQPVNEVMGLGLFHNSRVWINHTDGHHIRQKNVIRITNYSNSQREEIKFTL